MASAAKREGKEFNMSLMDFADAVTPEDMTDWGNSIMSDGATTEEAEGEKKGVGIYELLEHRKQQSGEPQISKEEQKTRFEELKRRLT